MLNAECRRLNAKSKQHQQRRASGWMLLMAIAIVVPMSQVHSDEPLGAPLSAKAREAITLLDAQDPYQRQLGFLRLEALRDPSTVETILRYVHNQDEDTRAASLRALSAIEGVVASPILLEALKRDRSARVRRAALLGLEPLILDDPFILPACLKALRDPESDVRITAADVVSRVNDPQARQALLLRAKRERNQDVRRVIEAALKRLPS